MALRFGKRCLGTVAIPVTFLAGYFLARPDFLVQEYLVSSLIIVLGSSLISLGLGHIIYHLNRTNFFKEKKLEYLATHDLLTELLSRREFEKRLEASLSEADRYGFPVSLMMIDLDHFKEINDTHGHSAGDEVLKRFGQILKEEKREADVAGRYGGEEFSVVLPHTELDDAKKLSERISDALKGETFAGPDDDFGVTCSIGLTDYAVDAETRDQLVKRADRALYRAKEAGRDRLETIASG
jgi:diguanylate cyclase (GGDEF)-like protein